MGTTDNTNDPSARATAISQSNRFPFVVSALLVALPLGAVAGEWTVTPSIGVGEIYTDNVTLAESGSEEWELITRVTPGVSVDGQGRRVKLKLDYRMQNLIYARESGRNTINHRFRGDTNVELIENHFFVDADASVSQQIVDPDESLPLDNINVGNRSDVYTYRVSPYYQHNFRNAVETELRYTYGEVLYDEAASDSTLSRADFDLTSGREFRRLTWQLSYYDETLDRDTVGEDTHQVAFGQARYALTDTWSLLAQAGDEEHDFARTPARGFRNGSYWAAGFGWTPNRKFGLDALYGDRFRSVSARWSPTSRTSLGVRWRDSEVGLNTGEVWSGQFALRSKRTSWRASYTEETTTTQQLAFRGRVFLYIDPITGTISPDPAPGLIPVPLADVFALVDEVFIRKRAQISVGYRTGRSNVYLMLYDEDREFLESGDEEDAYGGTAAWDWRFGSRTSLLTTLTYRSSRYRTAGRESDLWSFETGFVRQLSRNSDGSLTYRHTSRDSSGGAARDYDENRITLQANFRF